MRHAGLLLLCGLVFAALLPYAGGGSAPLDSLAITQPWVGGLLILIGLLAFSMRIYWRVGAVVAGAVALLPVTAVLSRDAVVFQADLKLLQHNILHRNDGTNLVSRLGDYDVVTVQEVEQAWLALNTLPAPWTLVDCPDAPGIGTAVLSRHPVIDRGCALEDTAWARIAAPSGEVTVMSVHLGWPWPRGGDAQAQQVAWLARAVEQLNEPVVIAGDFNQMPWSAAVRKLARAADGLVAPGWRSSFWLGPVPLPIDHVIAPSDWLVDADLAGRHGSDHEAVRALIQRSDS